MTLPKRAPGEQLLNLRRAGQLLTDDSLDELPLARNFKIRDKAGARRGAVVMIDAKSGR